MLYNSQLLPPVVWSQVICCVTLIISCETSPNVIQQSVASSCCVVASSLLCYLSSDAESQTRPKAETNNENRLPVQCDRTEEGWQGRSSWLRNCYLPVCRPIVRCGGVVIIVVQMLLLLARKLFCGCLRRNYIAIGYYRR